MPTNEYEVFTILQHWKPCREVLSPEILLDSREPLFPLFAHLYQQAKQTYALLPKRKNGEDPFLHPINVVLFFKKAKLHDPVTYCVGLVHDIIEENVDLFRKAQQIPLTDEGRALLDEEEKRIFSTFAHELQAFCDAHGFPQTVSEQILATLQLLTRHKRHFYYTSISSIFTCPDALLKERAIQVKLADRLHNVLTIENFDEHGRLYQCFKNLFILNNAKQYLLQHLLELVGKNTAPDHFTATEKLFNKCCKATYEAFLTLCHSCAAKGIQEVRPLLQLAFKKYAFETAGLWEVTETRESEVHPLRLFQGVVRKYDARLHQEWGQYEAAMAQEKAFCRKFFADYTFSDEQFQALLDYKDAYSLKEVVAKLLYDPQYVLGGFLCSELSPQGRIPLAGEI